MTNDDRDTTQTPDAADRAHSLFGHVNRVLDVLLADPDPEGMEAAAAELGIFHDGQIVIGREDESMGLLDYYLFSADRDGQTRIEVFAASPPEELSEERRAILDALRDSRFSIFDARRIDDGRVECVDLVHPDADRVVFPDANVTPFRRVGQCFAMRVFALDGVPANTGMVLGLETEMRKFFTRPGPIYELSTMLDGSPLPDDVDTTDPSGIDHRILLRAILGARAAQHMARERGHELTLGTKKKRSLKRKKRGRRRKKKKK